jgi:hypothetical protein
MKPKFLLATFFILVFSFWPITVANANANGLKVEVYTFAEGALPDRHPYELCETGWSSVENINADWGNGVVADCQGDFVLIHYSGYITSPRSGLVSFQSYADDGFYMTFDGVPVIENWWPKGCSGDSAIVPMTAYASVKLDVWWYEYGGGACNILYWDNDNGYEIVPASAFSQDVVTPPIISAPFLETPFNVEGVADGTNVDLVWSSYIEDTPVERYAISWTYGGADGWAVSSVESAITIGGLPEDTDVVFRVRADNDSLGVYSAFSDPIVVHTGFDYVAPVPEPTVPPVPPVIVVPPVIPEPPIKEPETPVEPIIVPKPIPIPEITLEPVVEPLEPDLPIRIPEMLTPEESRQILLDNLMEEAQADDIQVPEEVANIPVLGATIVALTDALNFMGNVGADMSPEVRAKAKKEVVAAVVLTQISQFATSQSLASAQGSASASGSGSGSGSKTRRNKE